MALRASQTLFHKDKSFSFEKYVLFMNSLRMRYICYNFLTKLAKCGIVSWGLHPTEHMFDNK